MKNYQEYNFQRISTTLNKDNQAFPNTNYANIHNNTCDLRINSLEHRINDLEKKLLYYEELITIKENELEKYKEQNILFNKTIRRIEEIEESFDKLQSNTNYSFRPIDIENIIEEKLNIHQIVIETKLNDLSIMMQNLSQYNVNQQKQYSNTQEILSIFNDRIRTNSSKIKDLNKQMKSLQKGCNKSNSEEEELFFQNIQRE